MSALLGIDYGGTDTKLLLVSGPDGEGPVIARDTVQTGDLGVLTRQLRAFVAGQDVARFAVTVAGTLDTATGVVGRSANMSWLDGAAPAQELTERLDIPGIAVQDGVAAATAEARLGAGRGSSDVFVVTLGTGIAGAHVVRGRVHAGAHGGAGEIGHLVVGGSLPCACGQSGCLETLIGGSQLGRRWIESGAVGAETATARDVIAAAVAGDRPAADVLDRASDALARALLQVSALLDPRTIVVGGGLARSPVWTVTPAFEKARRGATFHRLPDLRVAELGVWAGAHGAVLCAAEGDQAPRGVTAARE